MPFSELTVDVDNTDGFFSDFSENSITDRLNKRFPDEYYKFVAVKDTNTTGLTGPLKRSEVRDNKYGN